MRLTWLIHGLSVAFAALLLDDATMVPVCKAGAAGCVRKPPRQPDAATRPIAETGAWGFSYGPLPTRKVGRFPNDDMMTEAMQGQWGDGRDDLAIMAEMGATMVRLYGNDPRFDGTQFLDRSNSWGLKVIAGISDYPFETGSNCWKTDLDCFAEVQKSYAEDLTTKKFLSNGHYHPALDTLVITNEPDLKFMSSGGKDYMRAVLSALDGVLAAELAAGLDVTSKENIHLTAAFSYSVCTRCKHLAELRTLGCCLVCDSGNAPSCASLGDMGKPQEAGGMKCPRVRKPRFQDDCPGLPMIMDLHMAMEDPSSVGYTFRTEGWKAAFTNRWIHSFNGFVGADALNQQFVQKYMKLSFNANKAAADMMKVFMGEYGDPHLAKDPAALQRDLQKAQALVKDQSNPFVGFNFFQFQVAYWKPCDNPAGWDNWEATYWDRPKEAPPPASCSERLFGTFALGDIAVSKTGGIDYYSQNVYSIPCLKPIFKGKPQAIAAAYGGQAPNTSICEKGWEAQPAKYCVAARGDHDPLGQGVKQVCGALHGMGRDCTENRPSHCADDKYTVADWAFSMYFSLKKEEGKAEDMCDFGGAALITPLPARPDCLAKLGPPKSTSPEPVTVVPTSGPPGPAPSPSRSSWPWWLLAAAALFLGLALAYRAMRIRQNAQEEREVAIQLS
ncbi:unnamed protein product [Effrenium voratum]|uniref:X8 domain-containing protein n=1 Tax=Effrenium voratum TaxID=2562239 RepID=A0AA36MQY7_9DINO|nr:unnamed protein product [Effrenium voratum]